MLVKCSACGRTPDSPQCLNPGCPYHGIAQMEATAWNGIHSHHNARKPSRDSLQSCQTCHGKNHECPICFGFNLSPGLGLVLRELRAHGSSEVTSAELSDSLGKRASWLSHKLKKLVQAGYIEKLGHGRYSRLL